LSGRCKPLGIETGIKTGMRLVSIISNPYQCGVRAGIAPGDTRLVCSSIPVDIPIPYTLVAPYIPLQIPQMFTTRPSVATQFTHWYA
jgi:hypothetical protein